MMAPAHMIAGATSWAVYHYFVKTMPEASLIELVGCMSICSVAALLPDIDHPTSTLGQKIYPVSKFISMVFGHRGITHSLLAFFGMMYLLTSIAPQQEYGLLITIVAIGYLSHLVGDVITPAGLPLLYPIKYRFTIPWTIEAGGVGGMYCCCFIWLVCAGAVYPMALMGRAPINALAKLGLQERA